MMAKLVVALLLIAPAAGFSSVLRSRSRAVQHVSRKHSAKKASLLMEDFGFLKNSGIGFDDLWEGSPVISEAKLEQVLNKDGIRFKMNKTEKEAEGLRLGFDVPVIGRLELPDLIIPDFVPFVGGTALLLAPKVDSIWEAMGFTATSNNPARQELKLQAKAQAADVGGKYSQARTQYLAKYGYPRLVGTKGIFYADQLSTDKEPMGGFGMAKSGMMFPVPRVVEDGTYGGAAGWGGKKKKGGVKDLKALAKKKENGEF